MMLDYIRRVIEIVICSHKAFLRCFNVVRVRVIGHFSVIFDNYEYF